MIKIKEIDKKDNNIYFIIYEAGRKVYTFNGKPEDVLNDLHKTNKELNDKQNIL